MLSLLNVMIPVRIRLFLKNADAKAMISPQPSGKVERKFQTFFGRHRYMFDSAGLKDCLKSGV
jgi:hypothetical protein